MNLILIYMCVHICNELNFNLFSINRGYNLLAFGPFFDFIIFIQTAMKFPRSSSAAVPPGKSPRLCSTFTTLLPGNVNRSCGRTVPIPTPTMCSRQRSSVRTSVRTPSQWRTPGTRINAGSRHRPALPGHVHHKAINSYIFVMPCYVILLIYRESLQCICNIF